jgi:hypothetical protein
LKLSTFTNTVAKPVFKRLILIKGVCPIFSVMFSYIWPLIVSASNC